MPWATGSLGRMANSDLTPEQLEEINSYADAFRQEFVQKTTEGKSPKEIREDIHEQLDEVVPHALAAVSHVIKHSINESLRVNTSKWLIDKKLDRDAAENDPLTKLLEEMRRTMPGSPEAISEAEFKTATDTDV